MKKINERGYSVIVILIFVAIILIIAAIVIPQIITRASFNHYFGIVMSSSWKDDPDAREVVRPLIDKRLAELNADAARACADLIFAEPATNPEEVVKRLNALGEQRSKCIEATGRFHKANAAAKSAGF